MSKVQLSPDQIKHLVIMFVLEAICILAGVAMFMTTGNIIWLAIGVVAGLGFSLPLVLKLILKSREKSGA
ncbi:MAG: hypothetical protein CMK09_13585 [Ponticaulis sp.]|nr:hypothetical protein [Ponticaulis sp.]|tara:strand:- start:81750 stop:81959 length:210 start_codon:yes stop_codon:yes gene_type:complete